MQRKKLDFKFYSELSAFDKFKIIVILKSFSCPHWDLMHSALAGLGLK